jgi:signal transduction histidine kinase/DNA-binding response OmpR family regulator
MITQQPQGKSFRLVRYFSVTAFLIMSAAAAALALGYKLVVETQLVDQASRSSVALARVIYNATQADSRNALNGSHVEAVAVDAVDQTIRRTVNGTSVHKVAAYNPDGATLYSTEPSQIGVQGMDKPALASAMAGKVASTLSYRDPLAGEVFPRQLLSTYVPIPDADGRVSLIFEICDELPSFTESLNDKSLQAFASICLLMILVYGALLGVVKRGAMLIRRQQDALRRAHLQLVAAKEAAEEANRAKSAFLATMSHEIRTPMHGILGLTQLLVDGPLATRQRAWAGNIITTGRSLLRIINDLLDLSKIEAGRFELDHDDFDLADVLRETQLLMTPAAAQKGLELSLNLPAAGSTRVRGDAIRLQQVMTNLVGNAIKFTQAGRVDVSLQRRDADGYTISVADTGIGIDAAALQRIFEPFMQADTSMSRRFGGTGLGLAIARRLVGLMGGELVVESEVDVGTTFSFTSSFEAATPLPCVPASDPSSRGRLAVTGERTRVLLAEDNDVNQLYVSAVLKKLDCDVTIAGDGEQALALWRTEHFDAILMDWHMPLLDGLQVTAIIRDEERQRGLRRTPIIGATASALEDEKRQCVEAGMDAVLSKPFAPDELVAVLQRHRSQNATSKASETSEMSETKVQAPVRSGALIGASRKVVEGAARLPSRQVAIQGLRR